MDLESVVNRIMKLFERTVTPAAAAANRAKAFKSTEPVIERARRRFDLTNEAGMSMKKR